MPFQKGLSKVKGTLVSLWGKSNGLKAENMCNKNTFKKAGHQVCLVWASAVWVEPTIGEFHGESHHKSKGTFWRWVKKMPTQRGSQVVGSIFPFTKAVFLATRAFLDPQPLNKNGT